MARRDGVLLVTAPAGRRVWGASDTAFPGGLVGLDSPRSADDTFVGVHPIDTAVGRRPARGRRIATAGVPRCRPAHRSTPINATLFPGGEPALPEAMHVNGERIDVRYVVGVLMGNQDLVRRLRAETGDVPAGTW
jgi:hypothetical protein